MFGGGLVRGRSILTVGYWCAVSTCVYLRTPQAAQAIQPMKPSLNPSVGGPVSAIGTLVRRTWLAQRKMPKRLACAVQVFSSHRRRETSRSVSLIHDWVFDIFAF
jgi:hypothetical protein